MPANNEIYVDSIGQLHFVKGMVRYDLVSYQPVADGGDPKTEEKVRIIMPPEGFLATFNTMQRLIDQLLEKGILQKVPPKSEK